MNVIEKELIQLGYHLLIDPRDRKHRFIFNCVDYLIPQNRIRYILVGSKSIKPKIPHPFRRIDFGRVLNFINSSGDTKHSAKMIQRYKSLEFGKWTKPKGAKTYNKYYKLPLDGQGSCPTILNQDKTDIIWKNRKLSIAEIKALQTLPQSYILKGNKKENHRGLGNVLPARMMYEFVKQFIKKPKPFPDSIDYANFLLE